MKIYEHLKEGVAFLPSASQIRLEKTKHYLKLPEEVFWKMTAPPKYWVAVPRETLEDLIQEIEEDLNPQE